MKYRKRLFITGGLRVSKTTAEIHPRDVEWLQVDNGLQDRIGRQQREVEQQPPQCPWRYDLQAACLASLTQLISTCSFGLSNDQFIAPVTLSPSLRKVHSRMINQFVLANVL